MIREIFNKIRETIKEKKTLVLAAMAIGLMIGIGLGLAKDGHASENTDDLQNLVVDTSATDMENETVSALMDRNVYFAGMDNILADADTIVKLENLKENKDILISYSIIDNSTGKELFSTDLIPSGQHVDWKPSESLKAGSYDICYVQNPFWPDGDGNYIPLTSANNLATLTLSTEGEADDGNKPS